MCVSNVLIVEKDFDSSFQITKKINELFPEINVLNGSSSLKTIKDILKKHKPELLIINLENRDAFGLKLLQSLFRNKFEILFVSNKAEFAVEAIKFSPVDFILKPLEKTALKNAIQKTKIIIRQKNDALSFKAQQIYKDTSNNIRIATSQGHRYIHINDIVRFEADGVYTKIILKSNECLTSSSNLGKYEKLLRLKATSNMIRFHRIHYKHLINLNAVESFNRKEKLVHLSDGSTISVAQRRLKEFKSIWKVS